MRSLTVLLLAACLSGVAGAYPTSADHMDDWFNTLGIRDDESRSALSGVLDRLQTTIDSGVASTPFRRRLTDRYALTYGPRNHRVLFHWGFNQDVARYMPLLVDIDKQWNDHSKRTALWRRWRASLGERGAASPTREDLSDPGFKEYLRTQKEDALAFIKEEHVRRNRALIDEVQKATGIVGPRARGLATLLWDIHILADHLDPSTSGLLPLSDLHTDIVLRGLGRLFDRNAMEGIELALHDVRGDAAGMREVLVQHLPPLLNEHYGAALAQKGIRITLE